MALRGVYKITGIVVDDPVVTDDIGRLAKRALRARARYLNVNLARRNRN